MEFRIGINLGDVIDEGGRIYGDGVNIAARLEGLAVAGGISISGTVYEHIKNKLSLGYQYIGEQNVKNIPEPIEVYRILFEPEAAGQVIGKKRSVSRVRYWVASIFASVVIGVVAVATWIFIRPSFLFEGKATITRDTLPLSERASIAVLPFSNLNKDL